MSKLDENTNGDFVWSTKWELGVEHHYVWHKDTPWLILKLSIMLSCTGRWFTFFGGKATEYDSYQSAKEGTENYYYGILTERVIL